MLHSFRPIESMSTLITTFLKGAVKHSWSIQKPTEILKASPSGVYTTMRIVDQHKIFKFDVHISRLKNGIQQFSLFKEDPSFILTLESKIKELCKCSVNEYHLKFPQQMELKVQVLLYDSTLQMCLTNIPSIPTDCQVELASIERHNVGLKDSQWAKEREIVEKTMHPESNEALIHSNGYIYEGLSSNFFWIRNGIVHSSPKEDILVGSVMELVLESCTKNNIQVKFEKLALNDLKDIESAFLTSTSRLVLPVSKIIIKEANNLSEVINLKVSPLLLQLKNLINILIDKESTSFQ